VTTKTDQGSGAPEPTARSADLSADDDRRPVDSLPSIIVDPSAFAAVADQREDERSSDSSRTNGEPAGPAPEPYAAAPAQNGTAHEHEHGTGDDAQPDPEDRFSVEEAERFAEHFRPSWEPLPPVVAAPVEQKARVVVVAPDPAEELDSVLPRRQRRRGLIMVGAAVCAFAALTALALMSASHDALPDEHAEAPAPPAAAPAAAPSAAPKPAAAPTAAAQPAPAALAAPAAPSNPTAGTSATEPAATIAAADPATAVPAGQPVPLPANPTAAAPAQQAAPSVAAAASPPVSAVAAIAQAVAPAAAPEAARTQANTVRIQLKTVPASATLLIDGTSVANPFDVVVEKSGKHRVQAQAPGYRESDFTLNFDRPRDLSLRLQKVRVVRKQAARRAAPARAPAASREPAKFSVRPAPDPTPEPSKPAPVAPKPAKGAGFVSESPY